MSDVKRFAGFPSPGILVRDPALTREDKIGALESWRLRLARDDTTAQDEGSARDRLIGEIRAALHVLGRN